MRCAKKLYSYQPALLSIFTYITSYIKVLCDFLHTLEHLLLNCGHLNSAQEQDILHHILSLYFSVSLGVFQCVIQLHSSNFFLAPLSLHHMKTPN